MRMGLSVWLNWIVSVGAILTTYVLLPFNIHRLGNEAYGTWLLVNSITGYLALLTLGAPMATLRFVAQFAAKEDANQLEEALGTFAGLYLAMGAAAILIGGALLVGFEAFYQVPSHLARQAQWAFGGVVLCVAIGFIQQLPYGVMAAYHDFGVRSALMGCALIVRLVGNLVIVSYWPNIMALAVLNLLVTVFEASVGWIVLRRRYPQLSVRLSRSTVAMLRRVFSFSAFVVLLNVGIQLSYQTDALVIGKFMPVSTIPFYTVPNSLMLYLLEFVAAIAVVVMPSATTLHSNGNNEALRALFLKWSKVTFSIGLAAGCLVLVFGPRLVGWWVGSSFEAPAGEVLRILMFSLVVFLPARGVAQPILMGIGQPAAPSLAVVAAGVLNLALSVVWVVPFGLAGVAWGTAVPTILLGAYMIAHTCSATGLSIGAFLRHVVVRPLLAGIACFGFAVAMYVLVDPRGLFALLACCVATAVGMMWLAAEFVYRGDADIDLKAEMQGAWAKVCRGLRPA